MPPAWCIARLMTLVLGLMVVVTPAGAGAPADHPHFPRPPVLQPNIEFWKQVYTEYSVGDFVLHDRENLGVVYDVIRVKERSHQARAADQARAEIQIRRANYERILLDLAAGVPVEQLGPEGRRVAEAWKCPCRPEDLTRAAGSIRVQQGLREKVDEGLDRARPLLPRIVTILKRHDVPPELAALPLVESTFNPKAQSKAGAVGLWQFIKSTGQRYLKISRKRDDRRDPILATQAAARLLRHNYESLGSWPLAIIAYNHGHAGIQAASASVGSKAIEDIIANYTGPRFGFASKNFYAEFLAALEVVHPLLNGQGKPVTAKARRGARPAPAAAARAAVPAAATPPAEPREALPPAAPAAVPESAPVASVPTAVPSPASPLPAVQPDGAGAGTPTQEASVPPATPDESPALSLPPAAPDSQAASVSAAPSVSAQDPSASATPQESSQADHGPSEQEPDHGP